MSWTRVRRLLEEQHVTGVSSDPEDPRLGDLLMSVDAIDETRGVTCVILGVPQHIGIERNGGRAGAADGPAAIRHWLYRMATSAVHTAISRGHVTVLDAGDIITEGKTLQQIHDEQHDVVQELLDHKMIPIVLGGGHDTAWPTIAALNASGRSFGVINIDAHADVRPLKDGGQAHSGSPFRQMLETENSHLSPGGFVEYGLQHYAVSAAHADYVRARGHHVLMLDDIRREGAFAAWTNALTHLHSAEQWYVSLDMDGFASAFAPGVSAPSTDGFAPWEIGPCLRDAARHAAFRAFDVVETSPPYDVDGRTAKLAAAMIMQVLAGVADRTPH